METEKKLQTKKEWKTPKLTVLVRSKPEEAVLVTCKTPVSQGPAGTSSWCAYCSALAGS